MLEDLVSGKENSRFILIHDTVKHRGNCILNYITQGLLERLDVVILFLFDKNPTKLKFSNDQRLFVHDGFSDPLKWRADKFSTSELNQITKPFYFKNLLIQTSENDENFRQFLSEKSLKVGIIIDSLSAVISHQNIAVVCRDLYEAIHYHTEKCKVTQTAALVHSDLHDENISSSLNYIASTCIELKTQDVSENKECTGHFVTTHCKKSGKINRVKEAYKIDCECHFKIIPIEDKNTDAKATVTSSDSTDLTSDLPFKLTLTEQQKEARAQLQLPYLLDDQTKQTQLALGKKSQIFYQADEADDFDEEDPDDDLNI